MTHLIQENRCPICQTENLCQASSEKSCWCNKVKVPQELLELVPDELKGKSCICPTCIEKIITTKGKNNE